MNEPLTDTELDWIEDTRDVQSNRCVRTYVRRLIAEIRFVRRELATVKDSMLWMARTTHVEFHDGRPEECGKNTCESARAYARRA